MSRPAQFGELPDDSYVDLPQRAAEAPVTVAEHLRRLAERDVARPSIAEWIERTRRRGGSVRESDAIQALDELRGT